MSNIDLRTLNRPTMWWRKHVRYWTYGLTSVLPTLVSLNVTSGPVAGGTVVIGTGTNLASVTSVTVGGAAATSVTSTATTVTFTTPAGTVGPADVTVTTAAGSVTLSGAFTYVGSTVGALGLFVRGLLGEIPPGILGLFGRGLGL